MVSLLNIFLFSFKIRPFLEIVWNSFFYSFKKSEFEKVSHSSFLCLSAHASPKALLPLRYLRAAHTQERNIPTLYIQFKKSTELKFREKNAGRKVGHGACGALLRNGVPHNW